MSNGIGTPIGSSLGEKFFGFSANGVGGDIGNTSGPPPAPAAPEFTVSPSITGSGDIGSVITLNLGTVTGYPSPVVTWEWMLDGVGTGNTTDLTYTPDALGDLTVDVVATNSEGSDNDTTNTITINPIVPEAFDVGDWTIADTEAGGTLAVEILSLPDDGGDTITDIEYRVDGGSWTSSGGTSDFDITGLTDDVEVDIEIRAVNGVGAGASSDTKSATPTSAGFSPADVPNGFLWLKGNDGTSISPTVSESSGSISGIEDGFGVSADALQASPGAQPRINTRTLNSKPVIDFQGDDNLRVVLNKAQPTTWLIVGKVDAAANQYFFDGDTTRQLFNVEDVSGYKFQTFAGGGSFLRSASADTNAHIFALTMNGSSSSISVDGKTVASGTLSTNAINGLVIGSRYTDAEFLDGYIAEMLGYERIITQVERGELNTYLSAEWGVSCYAIAPMGDVLASTVMDIDATMGASYTSSQTWANIETTPADSAAQSAYDVYLGTTSSSQTNDPTFTNTADTYPAYFNFDGGDVLTLAGSNTAFLDALHKTTGGTDWWIAMPFRYVSGTQYLFGTASGAPLNGIAAFISSNKITVRQAGGSSVDKQLSPTLSSATNYLFIISYNASLAKYTYWLNTRAGTDEAVTFVTATNNAAHSLNISSLDGSSLPLINGSRLYGFSMGNEHLDDTKAGAIIDQYNARHRRLYA